ncbi:erythroid transcription factor-like [Nelusetta ayraudi]|uniref:erythroid transcription factor-like n=1 Tax=Nelusetta ayraudi TaxID=303726 RepID=UPI003F6F39E8
MSHVAEWPTPASAPSSLAGHACQSLCSVAEALPPKSGGPAPPARFGSHDLASDWPMGRAGLRPEPPECARCGTRSTSLWRREATSGHLCNDCSLQERSDDRPLLRPKRRVTASQQRRSECVTCGTSITSLWRRSPAGQPVCNACGLYYKLHQVERPPELRKDGIRTRRRKAATMTGGSGEAGNTTTQRPGCPRWPHPLTFWTSPCQLRTGTAGCN